MKEAFFSSPFFGLGVGSTGFYKFDGGWAGQKLSEYKLDYLNLKDAYSLLLRLIIEVGLPFVGLIFFYIFIRLLDFKSYISLTTKSEPKDRVGIIFLFTFSFCIIIGSLLKESTYSRSTLYLAWVLFVTCLPIRKSSRFNV